MMLEKELKLLSKYDGVFNYSKENKIIFKLTVQCFYINENIFLGKN